MLSVEASSALRAWWSAPATDRAPGSLGGLLRATRLGRRMTQEDVARRIGFVSQGQVSRWESGDGQLPDAGELAAWLDALDADAEVRLQTLGCAHADRAARRRPTR